MYVLMYVLIFYLAPRSTWGRNFCLSPICPGGFADLGEIRAR